MIQRITAEYMANVKRKNVLALDIAEHCGFYSIYGYGSWWFPNTDKAPKYMGNDYQQHKRFRETLMKFIQDHDIKIIGAEDVNVGTHFAALRKLSQFQGVLFEVCATMGVPVVLFNVVKIKAFATGKGRATKEEMMEACKRRWHIDPEKDDNASDAAAIFFYLCERYKL